MRGVTVEFTQVRRKQIRGLTDASLQPATTAANYGVISMMRTIAELSCWLLKSWHPWEEEEANQEDASGQYLDPPLTDTPALQPPWTDDKHHVSVQLTSMFGMCIPPPSHSPT